MSYDHPLEFRILSVRRSSVHAIISWLSAMIRPPVVHLNNIDGPNPWRDCQEYVGFNLDDAWASKPRNPNGLILSWEDKSLEEWREMTAADNELMVGRSKRTVPLIVIRDPFNMIASRVRSPAAQKHKRNIEAALRTWKDHAEHLLSNPNFMRIDYNRWFSSDNYRIQLVKELCLTWSLAADRSKFRIAAIGAGSSFDGWRYMTSAMRMKVLDRWRECRAVIRNDVLPHDGVVELARELFPEITSAVEEELSSAGSAVGKTG